MADPSRRQHQRFPCDVPATLHTPTSGALIGQARLTDLGIGGGMIETPVPLARRVPYDLRWTWREQSLQVTARVAWEKNEPKSGRRRFGLEFTTTSEQEAIIRRMVDEMRQQLWSHRGPR